MRVWRDADEIYCWECGGVEPQDCQCEGSGTCPRCDDGGITGDGKLCPLCDAVPGS